MYTFSVKDGLTDEEMTMVLGEIIPKIVDKYLKGGGGKKGYSGTKSSYERTGEYHKYANYGSTAGRNYKSVKNVARRYADLEGNVYGSMKAVNEGVKQGMISKSEADKILSKVIPNIDIIVDEFDDKALTKSIKVLNNLSIFQKKYDERISKQPTITQKQEEEIIEQVVDTDPALKKILEQQEKNKEEKEKKTKQLTKELNDTVEALENTKKALQSKLPKDKTKLEDLIRDKTTEIEDLKAQYVKNLQTVQERDVTGKLKASDEELKIIPIINQNIKNDIESLEKLVDKTQESIEFIAQEEQSDKDRIMLIEKEKEKVIKKLNKAVEEEEIRKEKKAKKKKYEKEAELQPLVITKLTQNLDHLKGPISLKNVRNRLTKRDK